MGYYSDFYITTDEVSHTQQEANDILLDLKKCLDDISGYKFILCKKNSALTLDGVKWYDWVDHMKKVTSYSQFANIEFVVHREGEGETYVDFEDGYEEFQEDVEQVSFMNGE